MMFGLFKRKTTPRLVIVDRSAEQERLERAKRLQDEKIDAMHQLGGFDTFFNDDDQNWARHLQLMAEFKRDIAVLKQRVAALEGK
jgi:hypothetical protein